MLGKYYDTRAQNRFVNIYTAVPYLDTEISNMKSTLLRETRKAANRTTMAVQGIERTKEKSELLSNSLRDSRVKRQAQKKQFLDQLDQSNRKSIKKQQASWQQYTADRTSSKRDYMHSQAYLDSILSSNTAKAASRLTTVRRWL